MNEKITSFLKQNGPSLPVELGKHLGYNSLLTNAVLSELIVSGHVKKSMRPIGSSLIYYLPGQENAMRARLFNDLSIPEKNLLRRLKQESFIHEKQLTPHERQFINKLRDYTKIIKKDDESYIAYYDAPEQIKSIKPPEIIKKQSLFTKTKPVKASDDFDSDVANKLSQLGQVISSKKIIKDKEYDYLVNIKTILGNQEFFVKAKNKQRINEHDLSMIYTQALKQKKPAILITPGKLTKKAEKWAKENTGELLKIIRL